MEANLSEPTVAAPELELIEDADDEASAGPRDATGEPDAATRPRHSRQRQFQQPQQAQQSQQMQEPPQADQPPPWRGERRHPVPERRTAQGEVDAEGHRIILIDDEKFTVVEGDLVLDVDQKSLWQEAQDARMAAFASKSTLEAVGFKELAVNEANTASATLVGIVQDGKLVRWDPNTVLRYCVLQHTFPRQEWYEEIVTNMQLATQAWEAICGVRFEYMSEFDASNSVRPEGVLFPVRYIGAGGAFIAAAFFPNDPVNRRRVLIDPSYFTTTFDHVGVLRHELGHVIGFRHEHIRSGAPAVCPHEDTTGTINLTNYDPKSVMHYFCGNVGSRKLEITQVDTMGAQKLYGPPLGSFELLQA
jgi:hypothetical protein